MDGYGNDTTASGAPQSTADAIAQIFATGVTAYTDSQAIQAGYQINDPRYFQSGYPAGVGATYNPQSAGVSQGRLGTSNPNMVLYLVLAGVALYFLAKHR